MSYWLLLGVGAAQFANFLAAAVNIRACAKGRTAMTLSTDAVILFLNFTVLAWIIEAHTWPAKLAYIVGGVLGSWAGMWLTDHWKEGELTSSVTPSGKRISIIPHYWKKDTIPEASTDRWWV